MMKVSPNLQFFYFDVFPKSYFNCYAAVISDNIYMEKWLLLIQIIFSENVLLTKCVKSCLEFRERERPEILVYT